MAQLKILSVAYPFAAVSADAVGGAEQVLSQIDRALVQSGHQSFVIATDDSRVRGTLLPLPSFGACDMLADQVMTEQRFRTKELLEKVLRSQYIDVVHMHGVDFHEYLPEQLHPLLATLHLPLDWYSPVALAPARPATWLNCVSHDQASRGTFKPKMLCPIENGVSVDELAKLNPPRGRYAVMLARVCPEKGQHIALQAARLADCSLALAGSVFSYVAHLDYFETQVRPLLDRKRRFIGPVNFRQKRRLLASAACLVIPSQVAETSSLVAMEAASCGTPVVAMRSGALPHVVEHGRSGFIVDSLDEMAAAMRRVSDIDPDLCRSIARERFSADRMTNAYIDYYYKLRAAA